MRNAYITRGIILDSQVKCMTFRLNKNAFHIVKIGEESSDFAYWQSRSVQERLAALEMLRQQFYAYSHDNPPRLQRVLRIVEQA